MGITMGAQIFTQRVATALRLLACHRVLGWSRWRWDLRGKSERHRGWPRPICFLHMSKRDLWGEERNSFWWVETCSCQKIQTLLGDEVGGAGKNEVLVPPKMLSENGPGLEWLLLIDIFGNGRPMKSIRFSGACRVDFSGHWEEHSAVHASSIG